MSQSKYSVIHLSILAALVCLFFPLFGMLPVQVQQLSKVPPEVKKQAKVNYHGEDMGGKDGSWPATIPSLLLPFREHQRCESSKMLGLLTSSRNLSPKDWTIRSSRDEYVSDLYVSENVIVKGFGKLSSKSGIIECCNMRKENVKNNVFIIYRFGGGEEYSTGDVVGYGIKINHGKKYKIKERVLDKSKDKRFVVEKVIKKGYVSKKKFRELKCKTNEFISESTPKRLPHEEVRLEDPAKSLTLKIRLSPTGKKSIFRAHMGGDKEYYPESFLSLVEKLDGMIYSEL